MRVEFPEDFNTIPHYRSQERNTGNASVIFPHFCYLSCRPSSACSSFVDISHRFYGSLYASLSLHRIYCHIVIIVCTLFFPLPLLLLLVVSLFLPNFLYFSPLSPSLRSFFTSPNALPISVVRYLLLFIVSPPMFAPPLPRLPLPTP